MTRNGLAYRFIVWMLILGYCAAPSLLLGHEIRPAFLQIKQTGTNTYDILWKIPSRGQLVPKINPVFPSVLEVEADGLPELLPGSIRYKFKGTSTDDLYGEMIRVEGLSKTLIDVLVHMEFLNGELYSILLQPDKPFAMIPEKAGLKQVMTTYLKLGVAHILLGVDHLLFVLALLLITTGLARLVKTITAFTIAHSITLSLSTLGVIGLPSAPVEAVIALSIVFLAVELIHFYQGRIGLAYRFPWLVAFTFGLLHGFGFAGALADVGLPQTAIPSALLFFNIGVEIGQLLFVFVAGIVLWGLNKLSINWPSWIKLFPPYAIGSIASLWLIERIAAFW